MENDYRMAAAKQAIDALVEQVRHLPPTEQRNAKALLTQLLDHVRADTDDIDTATDAFERGDIEAARELVYRVEARMDDPVRTAIRRDLRALGVTIDRDISAGYLSAAFTRLSALIDLKLTLIAVEMTDAEIKLVTDIGPETHPQVWDKLGESEEALRAHVRLDDADSAFSGDHIRAYMQIAVAFALVEHEHAAHPDAATAAILPKLRQARTVFYARHLQADYAPGITDTYERLLHGSTLEPSLHGRQWRHWLADFEVFKAKFARHEYSVAQGQAISAALDTMSRRFAGDADELAAARIRLQLLQSRYHVGPAHLEALDQQWKSLKACTLMQNHWPERGMALQDSTLLTLRSADAYCWAPHTVEAVASAGDSLPGECAPSPLALGEFNLFGRAGWWWFTDPIPIKTTDRAAEDEPVVAMSWRRETGQVFIQLFVSRVVRMEGREQLVALPTVAVVWADGESLTTLAATCRTEFGNLVQQADGRFGQRDDVSPATSEETVTAVLWFARFFLAASMWLRQRVVIERQPAGGLRQVARAIQREHKLRETPKVQIIELRRRQVEQRPPDESDTATEPGEHKKREYSCRWVVGGAIGFTRNQWYPKAGVHAPKWIAPFEAGPKDKPLKTTARVYAVRR